MNYLTVDFGSTFTKLTAIDASQGIIVGTSCAFTTVDHDVMTGFYTAFSLLEKQIGRFNYDHLLCCSSAAGGLKMVAVGLVPDLTAKAAKIAATSAGAKVIKTYAFELSETEQAEIYAINPDLVLLCGGTDGGNREIIEANARHLSRIKRNFTIIAAGNKSANATIRSIFEESKCNFVITENVMPTFSQLNIAPAKEVIRDLFIRNIIEAKGLSSVQTMASRPIIPTPLAVMNACELLSTGTQATDGIGELVCVDLGGATTDIYSIAKGNPTMENIVVRGLPEPFCKRTVEGDLGMRYSLSSLIEAINVDALSDETGIPKTQIITWITHCIEDPASIALLDSQESDIDAALAKKAIEIAVERHCGKIAGTYTPLGEIFTLTGKDLTPVPNLIGIGGALINSPNPKEILSGAIYSTKKATILKQKSPIFLLDSAYIISAMGLLSEIDKELALSILKNNLKLID